jgi:hypothetical protein
MQLVEQHRIDRHDPRWAAIDAAAGRRLNADVNGAYTMIRKVVPDAFGNGGKGRAGVVVHPVRLDLANRRLAS